MEVAQKHTKKAEISANKVEGSVAETPNLDSINVKAEVMSAAVIEMWF